MVVSGLLAIFLIIIVVSFQKSQTDLRAHRSMELASKGMRPPRPDAVDILVGTLADLAKDRIGALIVIEGKDPIARHIRGGIELAVKSACRR